MKEYFKKGNVIIVLSILFSGISFFGSKVYDIQSRIMSDYEKAIDTLTVSNNQMLNSQLVTQFALDSLPGISKRIKEYGSFLISASKYPHDSNIIKAVGLKRSVLSDIARFSKFENVKQFEQFPNEYLIYNEYLIGERKMVNLMHKFSLAVEAKSYESTNEIYGEMESAFFELEALNETILEKNQFAMVKIPQQKEYSIKRLEKKLNDIEERKSSFHLYSFLLVICIITWSAILIFAIKYETFKK